MTSRVTVGHGLDRAEAGRHRHGEHAEPIMPAVEPTTELLNRRDELVERPLVE